MGCLRLNEVTTLSAISVNSSLVLFFLLHLAHCTSMYVYFPILSVTFKQIVKTVSQDSIKSCRLVPQRAPTGLILINTTFHPEPPARQACLRICFGFGVYDYESKSLVHCGSTLRWFYSHLLAWRCYYRFH